MKYLKTYEFFGHVKKRSSIDIDTLNDLLDSDLDGLNYMGVDIGSSLILGEVYYASDSKGHPKLKKDTWFDKNIQYSYASKPEGNFQAFVDRGLVSRLSTFASKIGGTLARINSGNYDKGFELHISPSPRDLDIQEAFGLSYYVYNKINKDRLREYGAGCCLFRSNRYRIETYSILFYNL